MAPILNFAYNKGATAQGGRVVQYGMKAIYYEGWMDGCLKSEKRGVGGGEVDG